jgi:hypothetical protein
MVVVTLALATVTRLIVLDVGGLLTFRGRLVGFRPLDAGKLALVQSNTNSKNFRHCTSPAPFRHRSFTTSRRPEPSTAHVQRVRSLGGMNEI